MENTLLHRKISHCCLFVAFWPGFSHLYFLFSWDYTKLTFWYFQEEKHKSIIWKMCRLPFYQNPYSNCWFKFIDAHFQLGFLFILLNNVRSVFLQWAELRHQLCGSKPEKADRPGQGERNWGNVWGALRSPWNGKGGSEEDYWCRTQK